MDKRRCVEEFLDYGGNELFSTLMHRGAKRSECVDRLVQLLQTYSDSCKRIKGRSAAYRFMLNNAVRLGWLGRESPDLKSHRLTRKEKAHIIKKLDEYISSGGRDRYVLNKLLGGVSVAVIVALAVFGVWKYMQSEEYRLGTMEYFANQIVVRNVRHSAKVISFSISTTESISDVYMEQMPELYYVSREGETSVEVLPEDDLCFSSVERELELKRSDEEEFQVGIYKVVFSFYSYNGDGEVNYLPPITKEIAVN